MVRARPQGSRGAATSKQWRNGRWDSAVPIERGRMLVHSESEWRQRAWSKAYQFGAMLSVGVLVPMLVSNNDPDFVLFVAIPLTLVMFLLGALVDGGWHLRTGGSLPGVYEHGVEVTWGRFIPYAEVTGAEREKSLHRMVLVLRLGPKGRKVPLEWSIFGVDGSDYVESIVRGVLSATEGRGPPRLVVYPTGAIAEGWDERGQAGA